jgi:hypothetical protein
MGPVVKAIGYEVLLEVREVGKRRSGGEPLGE